MKEGPDIASIGALIGDPARANILLALMHGQALTATELAANAGVTPQTASSHLAKLEDGRLVACRKQGRHRYYTLHDTDIAALLESLMGVAAARGRLRTRPGPRDPALRQARICYDHLAGAYGVAMFDALRERAFIVPNGDEIAVTEAGAAHLEGFGIDITALSTGKRPLCRACLDWSARRDHLGGALGAALFSHMSDLGWMAREDGTRIVRITAKGEAAFETTFKRVETQSQ